MQIKFLSLTLFAVGIVSALTSKQNEAAIMKTSAYGNEARRSTITNSLLVSKRDEGQEDKKAVDTVRRRRRYPALRHVPHSSEKLERRNGNESGLMSDGLPIIGKLFAHSNTPSKNNIKDTQKKLSNP
ncbi:uncharacterized protein BX663DRAFT_523759 [Cokeromyces recurvatus]|uniref:uncharacterized protein n=1 Tax=Cokeromyces recurvatus TaxID=90255 RepID=UPI00221F5AFC|nr:uncharacterized protein BX663DRAFT_523759 [Cokeromyces recurvatus]KAI7898695.1 hypothetical protein BX663DRAFT_523759 [Cokeromyces recurvatus]